MSELRTEPVSEISNSLKKKPEVEKIKIKEKKTIINSFKEQLSDSERRFYEEEKREIERKRRQKKKGDMDTEDRQEAETEIQKLYEVMRAQVSNNRIIEKLKREPCLDEIETKQQNFEKRYDVMIDRDKQNVSITIKRKDDIHDDENLSPIENIQIEER